LNIEFDYFYRSFVQPLIKCRRAFQALNILAIPELVQAADSLLAPVRLGVCRPAQPFSLVSSTLLATQASEEIFSVEPLPLKSSSSAEESSSHERTSAHRHRGQRHRRRQARLVGHDQAPQGGGGGGASVAGAGVDSEMVEVRTPVSLIDFLILYLCRHNHQCMYCCSFEISRACYPK
jgi:E3 ubiquitin-protein ligase EDD1